MRRRSSWLNTLIFIPIFLPIVLIPFNLFIQLYLLPKLNADMEVGILTSMIVIAISTIMGFVGIFVNNRLRWYTRLVVGCVSLVAIVFSVAISGL